MINGVWECESVARDHLCTFLVLNPKLNNYTGIKRRIPRLAKDQNKSDKFFIFSINT